MPYNLLDETWIPVRRRSGAMTLMAPWELTGGEDPPLLLASVRPDFDGALIQFLIGLVQTTLAPRGEQEWRKRLRQPPSPEELRRAFSSVRVAFNLDGDGPRFMQDLTLRPDDERAVENPISALLIETPGENTLKENRDLFIRRGLVQELSYPAAALALFTLQTNAPSGGQGHRTSLRGGGPLTTIILGETLWETLWLNVLDEQDFLDTRTGNPKLTASSATFPWLAPTRTSEKKGGRTTSPQDIHPGHYFWAMPRRIRLAFTPGQTGRCSLTGQEGVPVVRAFHAQNYGYSYVGPFLHPLTPYRELKPGEPPNPKKAQPEGLPYRDWPQLVLERDSQHPARTLIAFQKYRRDEHVNARRLWAFGYDMDNMKAQCWYSGTTPLVAIAEEHREEFTLGVDGFVAASDDVLRTLVAQVKSALSRRPMDLRGDFTFLKLRFWAETEPAFFDAVKGLQHALDAGEDTTALREQWLQCLSTAARRLFTEHSQESAELAATDIKRVALAWNELRRFTSPRNTRLRKYLTLPEHPSKEQTHATE